MCFNRISHRGKFLLKLKECSIQTSVYHLSLPMVTLNYGKTFAGIVEDIINAVISNKKSVAVLTKSLAN